MPATVVGSALTWAISDDEASLVTISVEVTNNSDKKEARDKQGDVVSVAYYNKKSEVNIEGYGSLSNTPGASLALSAGTSGDVVGTVFVEEVAITKDQEDFVRSSLRAMAYEGIS